MKAERINEIRKKVREVNPLIHCITNPISVNQVANLIIFSGGRPIMAKHPGEVKAVTDSADALLLNLGNIEDSSMEAMKISCKTACENKKGVVLDLVGVACSELRRNFAISLLKENTPSVIKGNYSEIKAIFDDSYKGEGVDADSSLKADDICRISLALSKKYNCTVLASGKTDIVSDGKRCVKINNGDKKMSLVTGTGCMLGGLCALYISCTNGFESCVSACVVLGICGEKAEKHKGNMSFFIDFMDKISTVSDEDIEKLIKVSEKL